MVQRMNITFGTIVEWLSGFLKPSAPGKQPNPNELPWNDLGREWDEQEWLKKSKQVSALRIPIARLKQDTAVVRWHLWKLGPPGPDGKPTRTEIMGHPILDLWDKPNPKMTGIKFRELYQHYYDTLGKVPIRIEYQPDGVTAKHLWPIAPQNVTQFPREDVLDPVYLEPFWEIKWRGKPMRLRTHEMMYITDPDPEDPYGDGYGAAQACKDDVAQICYMNQWQSNFFRNGAALGKIVGIPGLNPAQAPAMKADFNKEHGGVENAHKTLFVSQAANSNSISVVSAGATQKDADFVNGQKFLGDRIRETLGVPPEIVGHVDNSNRATAEAADYTHQSKNIKPRVEAMAAEFKPFWRLWFGVTDMVLEPEEPVRQTTEQAHEAAESGWITGAITRNEWRRIHGEDPLPAPLGTQIIVPANMVIINEDGTVFRIDASVDGKKADATLEPGPPSEDVKAATDASARSHGRSVGTRLRAVGGGQA